MNLFFCVPAQLLNLRVLSVGEYLWEDYQGGVSEFLRALNASLRRD